MSKKEPYVYTKKRQPVFGFVKFVLKIFMHKPKIINLNEEIPTDGLIIAPHRGKWTPIYMSIYYPEKMAFIGAYPMLGTYRERVRYLRDVLYVQKCHKKWFPSHLKACFEAIFSKGIYKGMHLIPSYNDMRFMNTIAYVSKNLNNGLPVCVFPEDSEHGYLPEMKGFHPGFIKIAQFHNRRYKTDIKIYPMYIHREKKRFIFGKPFRLSELQGMSDEDICHYSEKRINDLYYQYFPEEKKN